MVVAHITKEEEWQQMLAQGESSSAEKNNIYYLTVSVGEGSWHSLARSSAQGSCGCNCVLGSSSLPELRVILKALLVAAKFNSFGRRTDVLVSLLAGCQLGALLAPRGVLYSLSHSLLQLQSQAWRTSYTLNSSCSFFFFAYMLILFFILFIYLFILRKISPELTTANPPLFAEEDWP